MSNLKSSISVDDVEIWRSASSMINTHGDRAWIEAVLKYFEVNRLKDKELASVWRRIARAIDEFSAVRPPERMH